MNLHEYQSKQLFSLYGIPVPASSLVRSIDDIENVLSSFNSERVVVKAQVHAGGRGKAGGVVLVDNHQEAAAEAKRIFSHRIITKQTGEEGYASTVVTKVKFTDVAETEVYRSNRNWNRSEELKYRRR